MPTSKENAPHCIKSDPHYMALLGVRVVWDSCTEGMHGQQGAPVATSHA